MTTSERPDFPPPDIVVGGFPCQDVSCAGKRAGLAGKRSGLYRELVRALRLVRPRYGLVENVAALLSDGMGNVLGDMAESGFDTEWDCVPAQSVGACHERDRVWIVAHAADADSERCGEEGRLRHRPVEMPAGGIAPTHASWPWRPPDSFAGIRDAARRNAADPYGARLAFREGLGRDAWEKLSPAERNALGNERQSLWPDEPALSRVDDGIPDWLDRVKSTGNAVVPQIPEAIGRAIMEATKCAE